MIRYFTRKSHATGKWYVVELPTGKYRHFNGKLIATGLSDLKAVFKFLEQLQRKEISLNAACN